MRFAGPRMIWRHPCLAIRHLLDERKEAPELPKKGSGGNEPEERKGRRRNDPSCP